MTDHIGIHPGGRHPIVFALGPSGDSGSARMYSLCASRACGLFHTDSDADEEYRNQMVELTDRLADFAPVVLERRSNRSALTGKLWMSP